MGQLLRKCLSAMTTIYLALTFIFIGIRLAPGDPVERLLGPEAAESEIQTVRHQLGLDLPYGQQYLSYLQNVLLGNLGESIFKKTPVIDMLKKSFLPTFTLSVLSIFFATCIGLFAGVWAATRHGHFFDRWARMVALIGLAFPVFSLAPILVILFALKWQIFPVSEWASWRHMVLPVVTLVIPLSSIIMRVTRNKYLEDKSAPWALVLKGKGLSEGQISWRVLKVILPTVLNVVAIQLSVVLAGTMITETIFDIPGVGSLLFEGIQNRDYPLIQGVIVYVTLIYLSVYFLVDYINEKIDPRIVE